jgi:hypothetical protein
MTANVNKPVYKKFNYRRAKWSGKTNTTLEKLLVDAHIATTNVSDRTFAISKGNLRGIDYKVDSALFLHIATYVPGQAASLLNSNGQAPKTDITSFDAPMGNDYVDGELYLFVKDNHVLVCANKASERDALNYVKMILMKSNEQVVAQTLELYKVADADKVAMLKNEGVSKIELDASLYDASQSYLTRKCDSAKSSLLDGVIKGVRSIFASHSTLDEIKSKENLDVKVTIKVDGLEARKHQKDQEWGVTGKDRLLDLATAIVTESDSSTDDIEHFVITTCHNNTISSSEIRVAESFRIHTIAKSLSKIDVWAKMAAYFQSLKSNGALSQ